MSISLRTRSSSRRQHSQPDADHDLVERQLTADPVDDFWSPYLTAAEAALRVPGLVTATSAATETTEPDTETDEIPSEERVVESDEDTPDPLDEAFQNIDDPWAIAPSTAVETEVDHPEVDPTDGSDVDDPWADAVSAVLESAAAGAAATTVTGVDDETRPGGVDEFADELTDDPDETVALLPSPPPPLSEILPPGTSLDDLTDSSPADTDVDTSLLPPPPADLLDEPGDTNVDEMTDTEDSPFFVTPEPEPIPPVDASLPLAEPVVDPGPDYPFIVTPEPEPIPSVEGALAEPLTDPEPDHPFIVTPEPEPIPNVESSSAPIVDPGPDHPYFVTPEPEPIPNVEASTPSAPSVLPPAPETPEGERMEWTLRGSDTPSVLPAPPPPPSADPIFASPEPATTTAVEDEMLAPVLETSSECPSCGSHAKIDLVDRRRGIQHLSCTSCYRMWQAWISE
ncbi:MAG: hypothetical protein ACR2QE_03000 [Acidimicrobiales bacterium]